MSIMLVNTDLIEISLKEITDLLEVRHNEAMTKVEKLSIEPSFGTLRKTRIVYNYQGQEIDTYILNKKQAIAVGAKLNDALLMKLIDKLESLSKPISFEEMAKQTILLADKRIKELEHKVSTLTHASKLYTSSEIAKELGFKSAIELNKKLNEDGIQYKQNNTWLLYSKYSSRGYVSIKQDILDSGRIIYDRKWTGIGRDFLIENYLKVA